MKLKHLIHEGHRIEKIGIYLDSLSAQARLLEIQQLKKAEQKKLYDLAGLSRPLSLDDFAPQDPLEERIHEGRNSLPIFSLFEKPSFPSTSFNCKRSLSRSPTL